MSKDEPATIKGAVGWEASRAAPTSVLVRVVSGPDAGLEHDWEVGTLVIGSHANADLRLTDPLISRRHAELALIGAGVRVRDLGSSNGTFVGEARIDSIAVPLGSEIRLADTRIALLSRDFAPRAREASATFGRLVGVSAPAREVFALLRAAAATDEPLLLSGAVGTGKSTAALEVHAQSARARRPAVVLPLADATPQTIARAFAGAAHSTLILEGLDEASPRTRRAILDAVVDPEIVRHDVRLVMTMRGDPRVAVEQGRLDRELWFLGRVHVPMPPLRERTEDLVALVMSMAEELGCPNLELEALELAAIRALAFEDNLHGLRRSIQRGLARARGEKEETTVPDATTAHLSAASHVARMSYKEAKEHILDAFERDYIAGLLSAADGNISRAAARAGIDRNHFARLAKKHALR
jgi:DNA-binding NtrC family response regulator